MGDTGIETDIDRLISLVEAKKEISMDDAAKELGVSVKIIEALGDVLEEEGIAHIKYKFTTPYLTYEKPREKAELSAEEEEKLFIEEELDMKRNFFSKAKARGMAEESIRDIWKKYVGQHIDHIKNKFFEDAKAKGYSEKDASRLWKIFERAL